MFNKKKRVVGVALLLVGSLLLTGCWNRVELDELSIVLGVALDRAAHPEQVEVSVQAAVTQEEGTVGDSGPYLTMTRQGDSVFSTLKSFSHNNSRRLFLPQNQVLLLGSELAMGGVKEYLDFFLRDHETRLDVWMFVVKGHAGELLKTETDIESIPAINLGKLIQNQRETSEASCARLLHFVAKMQSDTTAPLATLIELEEMDGVPKPTIIGMAVFNKDSYIGDLSARQTRGYLWTASRVEDGLIAVEDEQGVATIEIQQAQSSTRVNLNSEGKVEITVKVRCDLEIGEIKGFANMTMVEMVSFLEQKSAEAISEEIFHAFERAVELQADFFGFGELVHKYYPNEWETMKHTWRENLGDVVLRVNADVVIRATGDVVKLDNAKGA